MAWFGVSSYGVAAVAYGVATAVLLVSHPGGGRASWLILATFVSMVWAGTLAVFAFSNALVLPVVVAADSLHLFAWTAYGASWLAPSTGRAGRLISRALVASSGVIGVWAMLSAVEFGGSAFAAAIYLPLLGMALIGLLTVEQIFRNAREEQQRALWLLCIAVGGVFAADLFVYSHALLLGGLTPGLWESRGFVGAALAPLLVIAIKRQAEWESELFVSRQVAFYTASLLGVGAYLTIMALVAYVIRAFGAQWSTMAEMAFLVAAAVLLVVVLRSSSIRARLKVFLVKHFYRNKYDYRHEWLQLTEALGRTGDIEALSTSALQGLARIVGARGGDLYLLRDGSRYEWQAALAADSTARPPYSADSPIVRFLQGRRWVIDSEEYAREPDRYGSAFGHPDDGVLPAQSIIVPLDCQGSLLGFVVLARPAELGALNFEDHDILRTAGRQVAAVLAQALAQEQLGHVRQFEAMNKLSTFMMHDLKNVIAQQELVVANAQRFRNRPEFIDDAVATLRSGVERMRKMLDQLSGAIPKDPVRARADISKVLMEVRSHCADREPVPQLRMPSGSLWVGLERDRLTSVVTHLIRNAQDATPAEGSIEVSLEQDGGSLLLNVTDTGCGMDPAFVRDRLFKPFDSTKGVRGMGIGAYQAREIVRGVGGDVEVSSSVGQGTAVRVKLPLLIDSGQSAA